MAYTLTPNEIKLELSYTQSKNSKKPIVLQYANRYHVGMSGEILKWKDVVGEPTWDWEKYEYRKKPGF
jgi:hypothetical protein